MAAASSSTDKETADAAHAATQREFKEVLLAQDDAFTDDVHLLMCSFEPELKNSMH